jgi:hypothetical protein
VDEQGGHATRSESDSAALKQSSQGVHRSWVAAFSLLAAQIGPLSAASPRSIERVLMSMERRPGAGPVRRRAPQTGGGIDFGAVVGGATVGAHIDACVARPCEPDPNPF